MPQQQLGLLSFGVLVVVVAILLVAFYPQWDMIFSLTLTLYGLWTIALAGVRVRNPIKYERGAFSTLIWGIMFTAVGGAWFFYIQTGNLILTVALLLLVVGVLAVALALLSMQKK